MFSRSDSLVPPTLIVVGPSWQWRALSLLANTFSSEQLRAHCSCSILARRRSVVNLYYFTFSWLPASPQMIARHKISGAGIMKGLDFAKSGRWRRLFLTRTQRTSDCSPLFPPMLAAFKPILLTVIPVPKQQFLWCTVVWWQTRQTERCANLSFHPTQVAKKTGYWTRNLSPRIDSMTPSTKQPGMLCLIVLTGSG